MDIVWSDHNDHDNNIMHEGKRKDIRKWPSKHRRYHCKYRAVWLHVRDEYIVQANAIVSEVVTTRRFYATKLWQNPSKKESQSNNLAKIVPSSPQTVNVSRAEIEPNRASEDNMLVSTIRQQILSSGSLANFQLPRQEGISEEGNFAPPVLARPQLQTQAARHSAAPIGRVYQSGQAGSSRGTFEQFNGEEMELQGPTLIAGGGTGGRLDDVSAILNNSRNNDSVHFVFQKGNEMFVRTDLPQLKKILKNNKITTINEREGRRKLPPVDPFSSEVKIVDEGAKVKSKKSFGSISRSFESEDVCPQQNNINNSFSRKPSIFAKVTQNAENQNNKSILNRSKTNGESRLARMKSVGFKDGESLAQDSSNQQASRDNQFPSMLQEDIIPEHPTPPARLNTILERSRANLPPRR
jgi:hypothetical protein